MDNDTTARQSTPDRWTGGSNAGCSHSPGPTVVIGCPRHLGMPWHPEGAREKVIAQGSCAPQGLEAAAPCQAQSGSAAGNEVGIAGARQCAVPLCSARLCAGFTCGNMEMTWWRECGYFPGGQGVAGSNPAVPTGIRVFSNIVTSHMSRQKSQLVVQRPF